MLSLASRLPRWVASTAAAAGAMGLLSVVVHFAGPLPPFLFAFPAVMAVATACGAAPALLTALLCAGWWFVPPLQPAGAAAAGLSWTTTAVFLMAAGFVAWFLGRRPARRPAAVVPHTHLRGAVVLLSLAVLLPATVFLIVAQRTHEQAFESAELRVNRAARIVREHAAKVMDTNEVLIGRIEDMVQGLDDDEIRRREPALHARLAAFTARLPQVAACWLSGRDGTLLLSDRDLVGQMHGADKSRRAAASGAVASPGGLSISGPVDDPRTRQPFFDTTRERNRTPKGLDGTVSVALRPAFFNQFYAELVREEPGLSVVLMRQDGTLLSRYPPKTTGSTHITPDSDLARRIQQGQRQGVVVQRSSFDLQLRLMAFRAVDGYPLYAAAGLSHEAIVQAWRRDMAAFAAFFFPMAGALVWATWFALRRARREHEALLQLRGEVEQRVKAERALVQSQKLEALGQLTGSVAHDFNNLLAVVSNNAFLIERQRSIDKVGPLAAAIRRAVTTGTQLTRQLLAFSRHQAVRPEDVNLGEMLPNTVELLRTTVGSHITVSLHLSPGLRAVRVDAAELELALINLALNARHAMPQGGRLTIMARSAAPQEVSALRGGHFVVISASDTGSGIAPELLDRVFEPFFTTKPEGQGTGLGLSQVYATCAQVGGTARIESHPDLGTTVLLFLPAAERQPVPSVVSPPATPMPVDCRLLLVEDNTELAQATQSLLVSFGVVVTRAADAQEALQTLRLGADRFDAVLSDVVMPGELNGLALAQRLRGTHPMLPVVLMTGYTSEIHKALAAGFQVLPKPFVPEDLLNTLTAVRRTRAAAASA